MSKLSQQTVSSAMKTALALVEKYHNAINRSPFYAFLLDREGRFLSANPYAVKDLGENPTGKTLFDLFPSDIASQRLDKIRKVIDSDEVTVTQEEVGRDLFYFHYIPTEIFGTRFCSVFALKVPWATRITRLLEASKKLDEVIPTHLEKNEFCEKVAGILCEIEDVNGAYVSINGTDVMRGEVFGKGLQFTLKACNQPSGEIVLWLKREPNELEFDIIDDIIHKIAMKAEFYELVQKLHESVAKIAYVVDSVRNAVTVIKLYGELRSEGEISKDRWDNILKEQVERILDKIQSLEDNWKSAENVLLSLRWRWSPC